MNRQKKLNKAATLPFKYQNISLKIILNSDSRGIYTAALVAPLSNDTIELWSTGRSSSEAVSRLQKTYEGLAKEMGKVVRDLER